MVKLLLFKIVFFSISSFSLIYSVGNKYPVDMDGSLGLFPINTYKGIYQINDDGWFIVHKKNIPSCITIKNKCYPIKKFYLHHTFDFAIFKINLSDNIQKNTNLFLKYLATEQELDYYSNWVTICAFISPLLYEINDVSDLKNYSKPLSCISKVTNKENVFFMLEAKTSMENLYKETWRDIKATNKAFYYENFNHLNTLLKNSESKKYDESFLKKLETIREKYYQEYRSVCDIHNSFTDMTNIQKTKVIQKINMFFYSNFIGVADKEDQGGFVLVASSKIDLDKNEYVCYRKVAGITHVNKETDFIKGEKSTAINLTTTEIRDWISTHISIYYEEKEKELNNGKRYSEESSSSNSSKKTRV